MTLLPLRLQRCYWDHCRPSRATWDIRDCDTPGQIVWFSILTIDSYKGCTWQAPRSGVRQLPSDILGMQTMHWKLWRSCSQGLSHAPTHLPRLMLMHICIPGSDTTVLKPFHGVGRLFCWGLLQVSPLKPPYGGRGQNLETLILTSHSVVSTFHSQPFAFSFPFPSDPRSVRLPEPFAWHFHPTTAKGDWELGS